MSFRDHERAVVTNFRGWRSVLEETDVGREYALNAKNMRFLPGQAVCREGHIAVFTPSGACTTLHNWINSAFNCLIYRDGTGLKARFLSYSDQTVALFTQSAYADVVAEAGMRAYIASFNSSGLGAGHLRISDATAWPAFSTDKAFEPALAEVPTVIDNGSGGCSKGLHYVRCVLESRSGFYSKPGTAVSVDLTSDGREIKVTLEGAYPDAAEKVHIIMTRVGNKEKYYWTGTSVAVPGGQTFQVNALVNISDENLADKEEAAEQFNVLTQVGGVAPFQPSVAVAYGKRMIYIADDTAYISDPEDYQHLTADRHALILPARKRIITAFVIRGVIYWLGPHWTYFSQDNNDYPSTWAQPEPLDEQIGTQSPRGVTVASTRDHAWVADESGLYFFNGAYSELPISYFNKPEWDRINWEYAHKVQVLDDPAKHAVRVIAPLDSATNCSHELVWYYEVGKEMTAVNFTLDDISGHEPGAVAMVEHYPSKVRRRWIAGVGSGDKVFRQDDDTHKDDTSLAIDSRYRTCSLPKRPGGWINAIRRWLLRMTGSGTAFLTAYSLDGKTERGLYEVDLESAPGGRVARATKLLTEQASIEIRTNDVDAWFSLSEVVCFWKRWAGK